MVSISFDGFNSSASGYRIATCFDENGFAEFHVYTKEVTERRNEFPPVELKPDGSGNLSIRDTQGFREYDFNKIKLIGGETHVTQQKKVRYLIFKYDPDDINNTGKSYEKHVTVTNKRKISEGKVLPYNIKLGNVPHSLLSFANRFIAQEPLSLEMLKFENSRSNENSFLELVLELSKSLQDPNVEGFEPKTITYKGDLTAEINYQTLKGILVFESHGDFVYEITPDLDNIIVDANRGLGDYVSYDIVPFLPSQILDHAVNQNPVKEDRRLSIDTIETAIIVMNRNNDDIKFKDII
ncbi:hypothetical protein Q0590_28270 [Rhodocytophaga aerolata]|uniref:Uncharacterized protein n=1 Tax=Rhodocytophaga aerolata TaxID=455078 RepID=A0ABT8RDM9_9BACT|nr:hypothetical protein [Rhodocytophaga aerolata]MDO1450209.1 hypothetical protein [Rhodocytophaga aerolata]